MGHQRIPLAEAVLRWFGNHPWGWALALAVALVALGWWWSRPLTWRNAEGYPGDRESRWLPGWHGGWWGWLDFWWW
jgi:hypothetical protein